jgi:hypothetical protein
MLQGEISVLAGHPLLLRTVLAEMKLDIIELDESRLWNNLVAVEMWSKQTNAPAVGARWGSMASNSLADNNSDGNNINDGLQSITIEVLGVLQVITYTESHAKALLLSIEEMQRSIDAVNDLAKSTADEYIAKTGAIPSENLDLLAHKTRVLINNIHFVEKGAQAQQSAVRTSALAKQSYFHVPAVSSTLSKNVRGE